MGRGGRPPHPPPQTPREPQRAEPPKAGKEEGKRPDRPNTTKREVVLHIGLVLDRNLRLGLRGVEAARPDNMPNIAFALPPSGIPEGDKTRIEHTGEDSCFGGGEVGLSALPC